MALDRALLPEGIVTVLSTCHRSLHRIGCSVSSRTMTIEPQPLRDGYGRFTRGHSPGDGAPHVDGDARSAQPRGFLA